MGSLKITCALKKNPPGLPIWKQLGRKAWLMKSKLEEFSAETFFHFVCPSVKYYSKILSWKLMEKTHNAAIITGTNFVFSLFKRQLRSRVHFRKSLKDVQFKDLRCNVHVVSVSQKDSFSLFMHLQATTACNHVQLIFFVPLKQVFKPDSLCGKGVSKNAESTKEVSINLLLGKANAFLTYKLLDLLILWACDI